MTPTAPLDNNNNNDELMTFGQHVLLRLTYISRSNDNNANIEIARILEQAQRNNERDGITGVLVINDRFFLQSIEGSRSTINTLLKKLLVDERHSSLQVVECCEVNERRWSQWSMKYLTTTEKNASQILKFSANANFNPYLMSAVQINSFIEALSKQQKKEDKRRAKQQSQT